MVACREPRHSPAHPFAVPSDLPYGLPRFAEIGPEAFRAAFDQGMADERAEVAAIVADPEPATFENTVVALERSGRVLRRARAVFGLLTSADTTDELEAVETEYASRFAAHGDAIMLDDRLFARIAAVHEQRDELGLDAEQTRLLDRYHTDFVRAGAALDRSAQERLAAINLELADCSTRFGNQLLADTNDAAVHFVDATELDGLSEDAIAAAREAALQRGLDGYLITLVLPTHQPALESLRSGAARRRLLAAAQARGSRGNAYDTRDIAAADGRAAGRTRRPARLPDAQRLRPGRPHGEGQRQRRRDAPPDHPGGDRERPARAGGAGRRQARRRR